MQRLYKLRKLLENMTNKEGKATVDFYLQIYAVSCYPDVARGGL